MAVLPWNTNFEDPSLSSRGWVDLSAVPAQAFAHALWERQAAAAESGPGTSFIATAPTVLDGDYALDFFQNLQRQCEGLKHYYVQNVDPVTLASRSYAGWGISITQYYESSFSTGGIYTVFIGPRRFPRWGDPHVPFPAPNGWRRTFPREIWTLNTANCPGVAGQIARFRVMDLPPSAQPYYTAGAANPEWYWWGSSNAAQNPKYSYSCVTPEDRTVVKSGQLYRFVAGAWTLIDPIAEPAVQDPDYLQEAGLIHPGDYLTGALIDDIRNAINQLVWLAGDYSEYLSPISGAYAGGGGALTGGSIYTQTFTDNGQNLSNFAASDRSASAHANALATFASGANLSRNGLNGTIINDPFLRGGTTTIGMSAASDGSQVANYAKESAYWRLDLWNSVGFTRHLEVYTYPEPARYLEFVAPPDWRFDDFGVGLQPYLISPVLYQTDWTPAAQAAQQTILSTTLILGDPTIAPSPDPTPFLDPSTSSQFPQFGWNGVALTLAKFDVAGGFQYTASS